MLTLCFGTRPEAIKLGVVAAELRESGTDFAVVCSGQHNELLSGTPAENDLWPAHELRLRSSGNVVKWCERATAPLRAAFRHLDSSLVVVQGDTMTAVTAARVAKQSGLALAHVEAGVRSGNLDEPWPEEGFRREITQLADWHYAPTAQAYANLIAEGVAQNRIRFAGNPVVSALARYAPYKAVTPPFPQVLVTMHRREWLQSGAVTDVYRALVAAAHTDERVTYVWPMHPAVATQIPTNDAYAPNLQLVAPLRYKDAILFLTQSIGVITDSGGLVEEAATLGVPAAIMRRYNDRPEAVEAGIAMQFDPTSAGVEAAVATLLGGRMARRPTSAFGQFDAAAQIARHLAILNAPARVEIAAEEAT